MEEARALFGDDDMDEDWEAEEEEEEGGGSPSPFRNRNGAARGNEPSRMEEQIAHENELRWQVAKTFFDHRGLVMDQIESYNNFVEKGIQEMFREAEPFEVDPPDEERASQKRVLISFSDVELNCKPEVEKSDRDIMSSEDANGSSKASGKGADKGKGKGRDGMDAGQINWFADTDPGSSNGAANHEAAGGSSSAQKSSGGANWGDDDHENAEENGSGWGGEEDDENGEGIMRKGKGKSGMKYKLNVVGNADGNGTKEVHDQEPPHISMDTWALDDPPNKDDMEEDAAPSNSGESEDMEFDNIGPGKAGKGNGRRLSQNFSPPPSPAQATEPNGEANGSRGVDDRQPSAAGSGSAGKENGRKSMGGSSDAGPKYPPFGRPRRAPNLKLLPVEARLRGITYASPIYVKVSIETSTVEPSSQRKSSKSSSSSASSSRKNAYTREERVLLGRIPVMVKSSLCHGNDSREAMKGDCSLDPGGYFIIKGSEKVIVAQEERNLQRLWVSFWKGVWTASCTTRRRGFNYYNYHTTTVKLAVPKKSGASHGVWPLVTVSLRGVEPIPMGVLFCALGVHSDREILEMICYDLDDEELVQTVCPSLLDSEHALTGALRDWDANTFDKARSKREKVVALFYIGSRIVGKNASDKNVPDELAAKNVLKVRFLPHLGPNERGKALYLGYMIRNAVLCHVGRQKGTDRDDFKNKRVEFAGEIISHHFRKLMGQLINTMKKRIQKHLSKGIELQSAEKYLDDKVITRGLKGAFSSGNWNGHDGLKTSGVVFDLKRANPLSTFCQLRELRHFVKPTVRVGDDARHPTFAQWGRVCPIDTPDGESCGLVKNMALTGMVSHVTPEGPVLQLLADSEIEELGSVTDLSSLQEATKVFVNGRWIGIVDTREVGGLVSKLRKERRRGPSNRTSADLTEVEVVVDVANREVHIGTDGGRVLRPLLIVEDQSLVLNEENILSFPNNIKKDKRFQWLLQQGVVELLGIEEEERAMIALQGEDIWKAREMEKDGRSAPKFEYAELHPSLILGLSASLIPFPNRNQSSRNLFQAHKHSKQAIGIYVTNLSSRADTSGQHLFYPQEQLVKTNAFDCLKKQEMFSGQNAIVAIACYTGYNQEDSIIMDQSALDRGMFRTSHYRTVRTEEKSEHETFGKPPTESETGAKFARSVEKLDEDGLPGVGWTLGVGDVIVGKISKTQSNNDSATKMTDPSQRLKAHEKGTVEQVVLVQDEDGAKVAKVKLRETRIPQVGDKFSSMHGQKGIVGMVFTQEDLPFTSEGIVPDIIINPHAFPSRQTLGQMCESALGKVVAKTGDKLFATPFNPSTTVESISDRLHRSGYDQWGTEILYNGFTGQAMEANIFIGTTFYQRLTHMVEDKIKYRSRGHVHPLTRQPVADRKRHGGVKFGEMERDCLIAHGAAATLQERSFILSDFHSVHVCTLCEQLANWNADRVPVCRHCSKSKKKGSSIVKVELPYACKLLIQELMSMGISVRLKTESL